MGVSQHPILYAKLMDKLREGVSLNQLADHTGFAYFTVRAMVAALRELADPLVYIDDWMEDKYGRRSIAVWRLRTTHDEVDAKRPRLTPKQRNERRVQQNAAKRNAVPSVFDYRPARYAPGTRKAK